jgi:hypothetical protein
VKRGKGGATGSTEGPGWKRRKRKRNEALQGRFDRLAGPVTVRKREDTMVRRCACGVERHSTEDDRPDEDVGS